MTRTMESSRERSSDSDEDFRSASDTPSHGELGSSAALLAVQLAVACVRLHQRAQSQEKISHYPVGLPRLKDRRKRYTKSIINGNLRHCSDSLQSPILPSQSVSHERGHQQPCIDPCSSSAAEGSSVAQPWSMEGFSSSREKPWVTSDETYGNSPKRMRSQKDIQRASLQEHPLVLPVEEELEAAQDVEGLAWSSYPFQDREGSSCISNQRIVDTADDYDDTTEKKFKGIMDMNKVRIGKLPDISQPNSISSSDLPKARSRGSIFTQQDKGGPWSYDIKFNKHDDRSLRTQKNDLREGSQATIVSENAAIANSRELQSSDSEDESSNGGPEQGQFDSLLSNSGAAIANSRELQSSDSDECTDGGPEQRQFDSLLLWPVGLAAEAIAFHVRLIAQAFSLVAVLYDWCNSFASNRVRETWQAKERASEALSQKVAMITNVPPKVTESGSMVLKRAGWGCFAAIYVCILLSMLLFPTLLLDYVFLRKIVEEPVSIKEPLHFDYTLPHPTAVVFLNSSIGKLGSYSEHARPVPISHKVHITVYLTLPESDYNRELGMFQLSAELLSETGETIKSSSRPCILRFHSLPIRMLKTFLIGLPSLLGMFTESQILEVHVMEFEEQHVATRVVRILVQPKAGMPLGLGIPEIYSADVHIETHLPWLKNMMRSWKWTVYIWTGLTLYVVEIVMILCCCRQALLPRTWVGTHDESKDDDEIERVKPVEVDKSGPSGSQLRKEQVSNRRHSLHERIPTARVVPYIRESKVRQSSI